MLKLATSARKLKITAVLDAAPFVKLGVRRPSVLDRQTEEEELEEEDECEFADRVHFAAVAGILAALLDKLTAPTLATSCSPARLSRVSTSTRRTP
jgi:hypothetical protein